MIGLEKVIGKILSDAEADARETLAAAEADCAAITARYNYAVAWSAYNRITAQ